MKVANEGKIMKGKNGITLIALVITIIVLLILAGISISMLSGDNSILKQATNAKERTIKENKKEAILVAYHGVLIANHGNVKEGEKFQNDLQEELTKNGQNATVSDNGKTIKYDNGHVYKLDIEKGTVTKKEQQDRSKIEVGDYVEYTPPTRGTYSTYLTTDYTGYTSDQSLTQQYKIWRVLNKNEDGTLDLIPAFKDTGVKYTDIYFRDAKGYNNCVYILDDICKTLYEKMNSDIDKSITSRSLNYKDIINLLVQNEDEKGIKKIEKYRRTKTYTGKWANYPVLHPLLKNESDPYYTSNNFETTATSKASTKDNPASLTVENTNFSGSMQHIDFYDYDYTTKKSKKYEVIFGTQEWYWIASRAVEHFNRYVSFDLRFISFSSFADGFLFSSDGDADKYDSGGVAMIRGCSVCPLVSLGSNVLVKPNDGTNEEGKRHVVVIPE